MSTSYFTTAVTISDSYHILLNRDKGQKAVFELIGKYGMPQVGQTIEIKGFEFKVTEIRICNHYSNSYHDPERPELQIDIYVEGSSDAYMDFLPMFWYDLPEPKSVLG